MDYTISLPSDSTLSATITLPASKSISNRALIINALSGGICHIDNISKCDDTDAMLLALKSEDGLLNIGAAGTAMRFLTGYCAMQSGKTFTLDGTERMRKRPIKILVDALRLLGADITYLGEEGFPPLKIVGKTLDQTSHISLPGNVSSQYISSLMMIAPLMPNGLIITLTDGMLSVPYLDMTASIMREFGADISREDNVITIRPVPYKATQYTVESDWSASSYWFEIVALCPSAEFTLPALFEHSLQGDSHIRDIFLSLGVKSRFTDHGLCISGGGKKVDFLSLDLSGQPDMAQTIIVTASMLGIPFRINGLKTLKIKETDRIEALRTELSKYGIRLDVESSDDDLALSWDGVQDNSHIAPHINIDTYDDHRMALAFAPTIFASPSRITIRHAEVVSKSYPEFWRHLASVGVQLYDVSTDTAK